MKTIPPIRRLRIERTFALTLATSNGHVESTAHTDKRDGIDPWRSPNEEFIRAEREDDDGYDPYSDRMAVDPLFEEDPWR